jgi:ketosteroid isomerase-like protein
MNQVKLRGDENAIQPLKDLQAQLQALANGGGPTANDARRDAAAIPEAIIGVQTRLASAREEAAYQQALQSYRASANDKNSLDAARSNFQSIIKGGGRRSADAQKFVDEIGARVSALNQPVTPPRVNPPVDETPAVLAAVQRYADAFDRRDADALRQVWPSMTAQIYGRLKASFGAATGIHLKLANENVALGADGTTAIVNADITQQYTPHGEKAQTRTDHTVFHLEKNNGNWVIRNLQ